MTASRPVPARTGSLVPALQTIDSIARGQGIHDAISEELIAALSKMAYESEEDHDLVVTLRSGHKSVEFVVHIGDDGVRILSAVVATVTSTGQLAKGEARSDIALSVSEQ